MVATILSWVLTYALHSTVLIVSVWLVCKLVPRLSLGAQESLWKLALGGALLTSTAQLVSGIAPPWGHFGMPSALQTEPEQMAVSQAPVAPPRVIRHRAGALTITTTHESVPIASTSAPSPRTPSPWPWVLIGLVGLGSAFGVARIGVAAWRLRRQLATRRDVIEDPLLETWLALCNKAELPKRVRLSCSTALPSPVALVRREVCIPERAIDGLSPRQQESMLAHELAHVLRRDPAWLVASAVIEAVFFFQPLHHLVRRRIEELAEYQCDDWAARHSGTGVHLAKCLAEVASWVEHQPSVPLVANMASGRSPIVRRITRLLDERRRKVAELAPGWRLGAGVSLLVAIAWLAPGVAATAVAASPVPPPSPPLGPTTVVVEDVLADGRSDRARVHIAGPDQTVHVEVAAPRPLAPPPPPPLPPAPPARPDDHLYIIVEGGMGWDAWPFGTPWGHGHIGIDMRGSFFDDPFADAVEDAFELEADALEQQAEAYERQAEAWERAVEDQERAMEQRAEAYERAAESAAEASGATHRARSVAPAGEADAGLVAL